MIKSSYLSAVFFVLSLACVCPAFAQATLTRKPIDGDQQRNSTSDKTVTTGAGAARENTPISKQARENAKRSYKAGVKYGRAYLFQQALQCFQDAVRADPEYADAYYGLGQANLDLGNYQQAIDAFNTVIKLKPHDADAYTALGEAHAKLEEKSSAQPNAKPSTPARDTSPTVKSSEATVDESPTLEPKIDLTRIYRVGVNDVLDIQIPGQVTNDSTLFTVTSSGLIEHPLLGEPLKVIGLTTEEITASIGKELLRRSIVAKSTPEIGVRDYNSHNVLVSGLVKEPGTKILRREAIPLYVILADAQPLPEAAVVTVIQKNGGTSRTIDLANPSETTLLILPGDVVTVTTALRQFYYVGGSVRSPGELPFRAGLTLTQALLSAGGLSGKADKIQLTRGQGNGLLSTQDLKLRDINRGKVPDPFVEPGDRITILP